MPERRKGVGRPAARRPPACQACHEYLAEVQVTLTRHGRPVTAWLCADCAKKDVFRDDP